METLGKAREMAKRVKKSLVPPEKAELVKDEALLPDVKVPEPLELDAVRLDGLYLAVGKVNARMPEMVDEMLDEFFAKRTVERETAEGEIVEEEVPRASLDARRRLFESLAKFALTDKRLSEGMGLLRSMAEENDGKVNISNLNVFQLRDMPPGAVDRELEKRIEAEAL